MNNKKFVVDFEDVSIKDVSSVGGKNASLGEMIRHLKPKGVKIPGGFVITAEAYRHFIKDSGVGDFIQDTLKGLDAGDVRDLAKRGEKIRDKIKEYNFPEDLERDIIFTYKKMEKKYGKRVDVAVRSSATAEDLPGASFAGQHETFLNIRGVDDLMLAIRSAMASLFTNRAISYRENKGFDHFKVALSVGVQKMVRSDLGSAGVAFTLDTESGFKDVVLINGSWGLGELIVQGEVIPDEFLVFKQKLNGNHEPIINQKLGKKRNKIVYSKSKGLGTRKIKTVATNEKERNSFVISEKEALKLAKWCLLVEKHYSDKNKKWTPMDIEWAKDGRTGDLYIVQARPETVHAERDFSVIEEYERLGKGKEITRGASVGSKIASGKAHVIMDTKNIYKFKKGEVLITDMTDPDWEPIMKIASAIVTDKGGRTSHAAIVSRELGIPAVVGTGDATQKIKDGREVTVDTTGSDGVIFDGKVKFKVNKINIKKIPKTKTKIMMNVAMPDTVFGKSFIPNKGVGLAREEFIIASEIGIHPNALIDYKKLKSQKSDNNAKKIVKDIDNKTAGWEDKKKFYVDNLAYGIARIGAAFYPEKVIVRFSDFKTNEYRTLIGGELYEPDEVNPMLGWRGASRYYDPSFKDAFILECLALKKVRKEMGLENVVPMVPFCRTAEEGKKVLKIMAKNGLNRKKDRGLVVYMMCEIPSNIILADEFLDIFDGFSIGSNDLTQLTLGLDRDSGLVSKVANEKDPSLKEMVRRAIKVSKKRKKYIGICGQAPSDYPEFAEFLVDEGIESISLNPDTVIPTTIKVYKREKKKK